MNSIKAGSVPIFGAELGQAVRYNQGERSVKADTWAITWADDNCLYTLMDDTWGFDQALEATGGRNLIIGKLEGAAQI